MALGDEVSLNGPTRGVDSRRRLCRSHESWAYRLRLERGRLLRWRARIFIGSWAARPRRAHGPGSTP